MLTALNELYLYEKEKQRNERLSEKWKSNSRETMKKVAFRFLPTPGFILLTMMFLKRWIQLFNFDAFSFIRLRFSTLLDFTILLSCHSEYEKKKDWRMEKLANEMQI